MNCPPPGRVEVWHLPLLRVPGSRVRHTYSAEGTSLTSVVRLATTDISRPVAGLEFMAESKLNFFLFQLLIDVLLHHTWTAVMLARRQNVLLQKLRCRPLQTALNFLSRWRVSKYSKRDTKKEHAKKKTTSVLPVHETSGAGLEESSPKNADIVLSAVGRVRVVPELFGAVKINDLRDASSQTSSRVRNRGT